MTDTYTYEGPATLVINGDETAVMAVLHAAGATGHWSGTIHADGLQTSFWPAVQSGGVELRMPDGRRGAAQIDMDAESGSATVGGDGPAPF
ncbi:hypothetical protein ACFYPN_24070 [Streptomyces sp. NPDC005576]|uniref:hypothetical protein n=1 Tax=unclassified Streptomyces TaxID=2593676 RepID=UPI0033EEE709